MTDTPPWAGLDPEHLWHPYARAGEAACAVAGSEGVRLVMADGSRLVDAMASWWCAIHGYRPPAVIEALHGQIDSLPHVMFGGLTHEPAALLAQRLSRLTGDALPRAFFCDSGSVAVEVALKMAVQYQQAAGQASRQRFLSLRGSYHGDTFAAMSVSDPDNSLHARFRALLPAQYFTPRPPPASCDAATLARACARFDADFDACAGDIAGVIVEPVLQGAGGFHHYAPAYLSHVAARCAQAGILLIADEIATGFGRTGTLFACEHAGVTPDLMCVGKALTGGVLSLAAVLCREEIAATVSDAGPFLHGPTFMANPAACRAALASLELLDSGDWQGNVRRIEQVLRRELSGAADLPGVREVRVLGAFAVVEMRRAVDVDAWRRHALAQGVWLRPFGPYVYTMPPYVMADEDLRLVARCICDGLEAGLGR